MNCDRIFRAKRWLSLIPLNRTAALYRAELGNLTRPYITHFYCWLYMKTNKYDNKYVHDMETWKVSFQWETRRT